MENFDDSSLSGSGMSTTTTSMVPPSPSTLMTVKLRPEDVQAIITGLAANLSALAKVALMIQLDPQTAKPMMEPLAITSQSQMGKLL